VRKNTEIEYSKLKSSFPKRNKFTVVLIRNKVVLITQIKKERMKERTNERKEEEKIENTAYFE